MVNCLAECTYFRTSHLSVLSSGYRDDDDDDASYYTPETENRLLPNNNVIIIMEGAS